MSETIRFIVVTLKDGTTHSFPLEDVDLVEQGSGTLLFHSTAGASPGCGCAPGESHSAPTPPPLCEIEDCISEHCPEPTHYGTPCAGCGELFGHHALDEFGMCAECAHEAVETPSEAEETLPPTQTTLGDFEVSTTRLYVHSGEMPEEVSQWLNLRYNGEYTAHPRPQQEPDNWVRMRSCRRCGAQRRRCLKSLGFRCYSCITRLPPLEDF